MPERLQVHVTRSDTLIHTMMCRDMVLISLIKKYVAMVITHPIADRMDEVMRML